MACDGGADACLAADLAPHVLVGDEDSLTPQALAFARACGAEELVYPMDKDEVDLELGLAAASARGASRVVLTGVSGGRSDHALAVMGIAARAADMAPVIVGDDEVTRILGGRGAKTWELGEADLGRTLSVVALLGDAVVSEEGMRWPADHMSLLALSSRGVSNVVERLPARVTVHEGVAAVVLIANRIEKKTLAESPAS